MDNYESAMQYIETQEATKISYVKVGEDNKKLIVCFASNHHLGFERKTSLMEHKYKKNNFDVLYLRNRLGWYLGGLNGIGKNMTHTIAFLRKQFANYDKVLSIGTSAGGYASLLFGSLLKVNEVIAINPQTDLQYCIDNMFTEQQAWINLCNKTESVAWKKYNKIADVLNDEVSYNVFCKGSENCIHTQDLALHGDYHYDQIKYFPSLSKLETHAEIFSTIYKFVNK
jgi:hypothetical protein